VCACAADVADDRPGSQAGVGSVKTQSRSPSGGLPSLEHVVAIAFLGENGISAAERLE
jgi:hypothetical protein